MYQNVYLPFGRQVYFVMCAVTIWHVCVEMLCMTADEATRHGEHERKCDCNSECCSGSALFPVLPCMCLPQLQPAHVLHVTICTINTTIVPTKLYT